MIEPAVPVSMGSAQFGMWQAESALVTLVTFPGRAVLEPHAHDAPTLAVVLAGGFDLEFPDQATRRSRLSCPSGTIVTQPAGERHANHFGGDGANGVVLQPTIDGPDLPHRCARVLGAIHHFRDGCIAAAARRLAREIAAPDDVTPLAVEGLVLEMLGAAGRLEGIIGLDRRDAPAWLARATEFVHEHFREPLRLDTVATVAGVHPAHLAGVFRRFHGHPIGAYVRRLRLEWAAEQLIASDTPIAVIAAEAGFADQAHLTRWFHRAIGWSPAAYRQAHRR